ncbi:MAG TPA: leucyl/phenylalanyl-tRNA--protein transferase [Alphaproteobacteria bacterium]|jgi:leucyl/phenylalanyl-tRNA--protein transferase|nr:leucyl/phenylalanyl-tRNA--protein transferase [Alphaproteobacteria bacterium]
MSHLTPEIMLQAYARGIFPMAEGRRDTTLFWVDPELRGIIPLNDFHVPKRLKRTLRQPPRVTVDRAFQRVIENCAQPTPGRRTTWINDEIIGLYCSLHQRGHAHSLEVWHEQTLVGGLYGLAVGGAFFGESMFSSQADASKVALVYLVARLKQGGYRLLDTQFVTPHLTTFGAIEIARDKYHAMLAEAIEASGDFSALPDEAPADEVLRLALGDCT